MSQTLLALLAMMTVTMLAFNQQRAVLATRQAMINDELEVMASGIALQAMEFIANRSFDESLKDQQVPAWQPTRLRRSFDLVGQLATQMPSGKRCTVLPELESDANYVVCDDLSDFNEMVPQSVPFEVGDHTIYFEVTAQVRYVNDQRQPLASGASRHKEVVVKVGEMRSPNQPARFLATPVELSRLFSIP